MFSNLVRLYNLEQKTDIKYILEQQLSFMKNEASHYPAGFSHFLCALSDYIDPPDFITVVEGKNSDLLQTALFIPLDSSIKYLKTPDEHYKNIDGLTTFYVCSGHVCKPPFTDPSLLNKIGQNADTNTN